MPNWWPIARRETIKYIPGIRGPAHFRRFEELLEREDATQLLSELSAVMKKYGLNHPDIMPLLTLRDIKRPEEVEASTRYIFEVVVG